MFDPRTHLALALIYGLTVIFIRDTIWLLGAWGVLLVFIGLRMLWAARRPAALREDAAQVTSPRRAFRR